MMAGNENSGRKEFEPTDEQREMVMVLRASGVSVLPIADAIGISEPTLRKHFALELERATIDIKAKVLMARFHAAMKGNVNAQNRMLETVSAHDANRKLNPEKEAKAPKLGKKEQQLLDAQNVAPKFAPPSAPKLVVNN